MSRACATPAAVDAAFPPLLPGESVAVIGVSQHGKSRFCKALAAQLRLEGKRVLAWDPCWEWGKDALEREATPRGPLERTITVSHLEEHPELLKNAELSLAVRPEDIYAPRKEMAEEFQRFVYAVRTVNRATLHLFADEVGLLRKYAEEDLDDLVERGGKDGLLPYLIAQRWMHLGPNTRAEVRYCVSFLQVKSSDLRMLAYDTRDERFARAVATLEPHAYRVADMRRVHADALVASASLEEKEQDDG